MSLWTAIIIIVAIGPLSEMYRARLKARLQKSEEIFENFSQRLARLEDRMANYETIVLEKERAKAIL